MGALHGREDLCYKDGIDSSDLVEEYKNNLKNTPVNIVDLIHVRRMGKRVKVLDRVKECHIFSSVSDLF